jgi:ribonuclease T1
MPFKRAASWCADLSFRGVSANIRVSVFRGYPVVQLGKFATNGLPKRLGAAAAAAACAWVLSLGLGLSAASGPAHAKGPAPDGLPTVALAELPREARQTHRLIFSGGPFPYQKDGTTFMNRERLLPRQPRGFYKEYTVKTPFSRDRGARRIVCGGQPPTAPEVCYYTADHYASFRRIVQ